MFTKNLNKNTPKEIEGVPVRLSKRARRMSISYNMRINDVVLTLPKKVSEQTAREFIQEHLDWIKQHRSKHERGEVFVNGGIITVYGKEYRIEQRQGRGVTCFEDDRLVVYCKEEFVSRRVKDFLKLIALEKIREHLRDKMDSLGKIRLPEIKITDPKTRWGSCKSDGRMMFSWRLVLMPIEVLDYIVAHEAAHTVYMNHSKFFWNLCHSLTEDAEASKHWIKKHGTMVMGHR